MQRFSWNEWKSATLDALSIALNQYLVELNCAKKNPINVEDVYCTAALVGERVKVKDIFQVSSVEALNLCYVQCLSNQSLIAESWSKTD